MRPAGSPSLQRGSRRLLRWSRAPSCAPRPSARRADPPCSRCSSRGSPCGSRRAPRCPRCARPGSPSRRTPRPRLPGPRSSGLRSGCPWGPRRRVPARAARPLPSLSLVRRRCATLLSGRTATLLPLDSRLPPGYQSNHGLVRRTRGDRAARGTVVSALAVTPEPPTELAVAHLSLDELRVGPPLRERGIDHAHVAALAEVVASWPPIVVHRTTRLVIDGQHRVAAAKLLGLRELAATFFDGSPDDAYVEFVRRNVGHGLPLTLADRRHAARRIVDMRPDLSDRGIAAVCGLSPRTVARLREDTRARGARANGARAAIGRVGRDGRVRPIDPGATRARIAEELARQPDASLRAIASVVGASPETVRSVRIEMRRANAATPP